MMEFTGERYMECEATAEQPIEREHWQRYLMAAQLVKPGDVVLDIACGAGYGSDHLAKRAGYVYGIDISAEAIQYAKENYHGKCTEFLEGSVDNIPLPDESIDLAVSFETIEHVDEAVQKAFLREIKRVLRPNAVFVVSCPNRPIASDLAYELWGYVNEFHKKEHTEREFRILLEHYFSCVSFLYQRNENALVMDAPGAKCLQIQWGERKDHLLDAQNLIAVCGEQRVDVTGLACMIPDIYGINLKNMRQMAAFQKELTALNNLTANLNIELEKFRVQSEKQQVEAEHQREQLEKQADENKALHAQLSAITAQFQSIESSTIWRATKPLRTVLDFIKRPLKAGK